MSPRLERFILLAIALVAIAGGVLYSFVGDQETVTVTSIEPSVREACPPPIQRDDPAHEIDRVASPACATALDAEQAKNALVPPQPSVLGIGPLTTFSNGNLPSSALSPATGCVNQLANSAAAAWNHVAVRVHKATGYWLQSNGSASCYRTLQQQRDLYAYWCGQGNCGNAAVPGTSNHGWGLAIDAPPQTVAYIHQYGSRWFCQGYGSCSDAPWEDWHIKYRGGYTGPDPGPYGKRAGPTFHVLKRGSEGPRVKTVSIRLALIEAPGKAEHFIRWANRGRVYDKPIAYGVRKFQRAVHLGADGVYGPKTDSKLDGRWNFYCHHHKKPC